MEKLKYIIEDSTIAEVLGVQNFTNEESAILELVKNAYDAQSLDVVIIISKSQIIIEDNGIGMNRQKILGAWMHVGISDKKYIIGAGETARVLAGSKGVGRFAIARLGAKASVYTKMDQQEAVLWKTDWNTNTLETYQEIKERGTKIVIEQLRDNWTESRVRNLREFLSRTYNDDKMKIQVEYKEDRKAVTRYFGKIQLGVNCVSVIRLQYLAKFQKLVCDIESDEFKENVKKLCPDIDTKEQKIELNIVDELDEMKNDLSEEATLEEWKEVLENVGDFSAELYFSLKNPSTFDAEKYFYKHRILVDRYEAGVVLYRNAFSMAFCFYNSLTLTQCEFYGRYYAGGVSELTPSEFKRLAIPYRKIDKDDIKQLSEMFKANENIDKIIAFVNLKTIEKDWEHKQILKLDKMRRKLMERRLP